MGYLQSVLVDGEQLEYRAHLSPWSFLGDYIVIAGLLLFAVMFSNAGQSTFSGFLLIAALFFAGKAAVLYFCTELAITNRRIVVKVGFISRYTNEINLNRVEGIQVSQTILGRLLNYGTITINGTGTSNQPIRGIRAPLAFRKKYSEISAKTS